MYINRVHYWIILLLIAAYIMSFIIYFNQQFH